MTTRDGTIETMVAWIDRQPWPDHVKVEAHSFGDDSAMTRVLWQAWIDNNHNGLTLADKDTGGGDGTTECACGHTVYLHTETDGIETCAGADTLDSHTHKFAATWERSRIAGTLNRPCTFPGCRVISLDSDDDEPDTADIPDTFGRTPADYAAIATEERATAKLGLEVGCYSEDSRGIYSIERLYELVGDLLGQRDLPKDRAYMSSDNYGDSGRIIQHSLYGDAGATVTLVSGESVSLDNAHEYSTELYDELTDLLPTPTGLLWIWNDGGLYLWSDDELNENGEITE